MGRLSVCLFDGREMALGPTQIPSDLERDLKGPWWPSGLAIWHLITNCHLCVGLTPTSDNARDMSHYKPTESPTLNFESLLNVLQTSPKIHSPSSQVTDFPSTERQNFRYDHSPTSLRFFSLPLGIGPNDRGTPFQAGHLSQYVSAWIWDWTQTLCVPGQVHLHRVTRPQ